MTARSDTASQRPRLGSCVLISGVPSQDSEALNAQLLRGWDCPVVLSGKQGWVLCRASAYFSASFNPNSQSSLP